MKRKIVILLALAMVAAFLVATNTRLRAAEGDDKVESAFKQTYVYKAYLKGDTIQVDVKNGVATLTGTVLDEIHKALARSAVANLAGVVRVDNQLLVEKAAVANIGIGSYRYFHLKGTQEVEGV